MSWPRVAVVGPGGVGCYFGGMLARAGAAVTLLGRPGRPSAHLEAAARGGLRMRTVAFDEIVSVEVASGAEAIADAGLVLFSVKTVDTDEAAARIAPHVGSGAILADLQNGVDNPERMRRFGLDPVAAVVYVAAAVEEPGTVRHRGRGDLVIGHRERRADLARVAGWFQSAGVPCIVSENVERDLWLKLILNSMANATSALTGTTYRQLAEFGPTWGIALDVAREGVAVAQRSGCDLDAEMVIERGAGICRDVGAATSSTEQDLKAGRLTEIDSLNGYIARKGEELGLPVPVNRALWALVKLREARIQQEKGAANAGGRASHRTSPQPDTHQRVEDTS